MSDMDVGPLLDNAVSRALGLGVVWATCDECGTIHHAAVDRCTDCGDEVRYHEPPYSTDIKAAWMIVDHFMDPSPHPWIHFESNNNRRWHASFHRPNGEAWGETMPEAICRAALASASDA